MSGVVQIPWYATGFRGDQLADELIRVSALATQYGATSYQVFRSRDDRYKFLQLLEFDEHADFDLYWNGPEMIDMRTYCSGWYQIPLLYTWSDRIVAGERPHRNGAHADVEAVEG
ncbi:MAG: hypothetical protein ABSC56_10530 [Solirubrobacteraceae bacterium]|jgi:hypothetical protein